MKILLDHNLPRKLRTHLVGHEVTTTREMLWEELRNGALLKSASDARFDAFISIDKNLEYEQDLKNLPVSVIVLDARSNAISGLLPVIPCLRKLLEERLECLLYIVQADGSVHRLRARR